MVSRRKTVTTNDSSQQPATAEPAKQLQQGGPAEAAPEAGTNPGGVTINEALNEPPAKPARRRAPSRRASNRTAKADAGGEATTQAPSGHEGNNRAEGDHAVLLRAMQELSQGQRAHSAEMSRGLRETNDLVQSLRQAVEANDRRLRTLWQDSQETQTQLVMHTAQLNDLVQFSQAAGQEEEDVWDRLTAVGEDFRQASDRLIERMAEQMLRLEGKVDEMSARLGGLHRQLESTQFALQENRANLHSVRAESQAAAEQLEVIQRECRDTTEMLQATRQEIQATKNEVEATGDAALEAALQLEESRLRMRDVQNGSPESAPPPGPGPSDNKGKVGVTVDANALVVEVFANSPAQEAGLQMGDRITAVDGQPIDKGAELPAIILRAEDANEFTLEVMRGETTHLLTVRPPAEAAAP